MAMAMSCAEASRAAGEMLAGSFKPADTFFLIESRLEEYGGWQQEIVKRAANAGELAPILAHLQRVPRAKALFIRRPAAAGKNFFIGVTNQTRPRLYHRHLMNYEELLTLDINSVGEGCIPRIAGRELDEIDELYAVCTNGRHDPCCAAHGVPVYQALVEAAGAQQVWQTSHIGGHRMAATLIAFPQGIAYGHLDPVDAEAVVTNHRAGYLLTHKYRGRGAYVGHRLDTEAHLAACAGETHIREREGLYALDALRLCDVEALEADLFAVTFETKRGFRHPVSVRSSLSMPRLTSCGDAPKPMPQHQVLAEPASI